MSEEKINFEKTIGELESIVAKLDKGDMKLDDMLINFEKGIKLARECTKVLDSAEKKISVLTKKPDGSVKEESFTPNS
ncbi:MAG: exodeoxyribonuclease VII small subunit [Clostridiales bacterium]|jgi:exodeoxyribonuclease VII small subunit|nr:exodeoxyribonuclease VII small subunit [Clostridiales bacterium]